MCVCVWLLSGLLFEEDLVDGKAVSDRAVRYVRQYCEFFTDLCLQGTALGLALAQPCAALRCAFVHRFSSHPFPSCDV
jgi:hypothetical protein